MSGLNVFAEPPTRDQIQARILARAASARDGGVPDYRATRRDWSGSYIAHAYVEKVRAQGRQLITAEVEALNDVVWYADAVRFGERSGFLGMPMAAKRIAA
jgi:hypothetical protein